MDSLRKKLLNYLNALRQDKTLWEEVKWKKTESEDSEEYEDLNLSNRSKAIIALQIDYAEKRLLKDSDEELIRFLMAEETKDRINDPWQGGSDTLHLIAFLLNTFKNIDNLWYFLEAKCANFDLGCSFDRYYLLSTGIAQTFEYVKASDHPDKKHFYGFYPSLEECTVTDEEIATHFTKGWNARIHQNPQKHMDTFFWLDVAIEIADLEHARSLLSIYEKEAKLDPDKKDRLKYFKQDVERLEKYQNKT